MTGSSQLHFDLGVEALMGGYRPWLGHYDEMLTASGQMRPHWQQAMRALGRFGVGDIQRRFDIAERHLRASGVFYRVYGDVSGVERSWPLAPMPLVLPHAEWAQLAAGVIQRAQVLEAILQDVYGAGRLVQDGALPASLIAGAPDYLRPMQGIVPRGGRFLHFYAVDVSRAPDGRWWVLSDRTQAPSGAGYTLENRIALTRALPEIYKALHIERLAGFFQTLREGLAAASGEHAPRLALLSPGPANETYFEHAYLARYLGLLLVEGGDLVVDGARLYVRTVEGRERIDAVLRRMDADFMDPLELNSASRIGIPGLLDALRQRSVVMANALGAGLLESPALLAFLPALARRLLGEELALPNLATWWCGDAAVRAHVLAHQASLTFAPAHGARRAGVFQNGAVQGAQMSDEQRHQLQDLMTRRPMDVIAQEPVQLSTTPVWENGRLTPRPFALRLYAAATPEGGWRVMMGGQCRIAHDADVSALSMQRGGRSADVWVCATHAVDSTTLLSAPDTLEVRRGVGTLPSRAADNMFWLGRYLERLDTSLRVVRRLIVRPTDAEESSALAGSAGRRLADLLVAWGAAPAKTHHVLSMARAALISPSLSGAVPALLQAARLTASMIRDRLSVESWRIIEDMHLKLQPSTEDLTDADLLERIDYGLRSLAALAGLAQENMNRLAGWRFLDAGHRIERAIAMSRLARRLTDAAAPSLCLDMLLDVGDSQITYRARYPLGAARHTVLDLLVLDAGNPRSIAFQIHRLHDHLTHLAYHAPDQDGSMTEDLTAHLIEELDSTDARRVNERFLIATENLLMSLSEGMTHRYVSQRNKPLNAGYAGGSA